MDKPSVWMNHRMPLKIFSIGLGSDDPSTEGTCADTVERAAAISMSTDPASGVLQF